MKSAQNDLTSSVPAMDTESVSSRITTTAEKEKKSLTINEQKIKKMYSKLMHRQNKEFWGGGE